MAPASIRESSFTEVVPYHPAVVGASVTRCASCLDEPAEPKAGEVGRDARLVPADVPHDLAGRLRTVGQERQDLDPGRVGKSGEEPCERFRIMTVASRPAVRGGLHAMSIVVILVHLNGSRRTLVRSIGDSATILFAAVRICCGVPLPFGPVSAPTTRLPPPPPP